MATNRGYTTPEACRHVRAIYSAAVLGLDGEQAVIAFRRGYRRPWQWGGAVRECEPPLILDVLTMGIMELAA